MRRQLTVLIAGVGGASLGTEVAKSLRLAGDYRIIGCDISSLAFGHYADLCERTRLVSADRYIDHVLEIASEEAVDVVIPGAEEPMRMIAFAHERFKAAKIRLAMNSKSVVERLADKERCFLELKRLGVDIPVTIALTSPDAIAAAPLPCVVKPAVDSGGSAFVFFARDRLEVELYAAYLNRNGKRSIAQEYVPHDEGEFTVGVLSDDSATVLGTVALKRAFPTKLSVLAKGPDFLISSGFSQGLIDEFPEICATARAISIAVGSVGPLNIQGRLSRDGRFLPFEINPRFSASTYLRALAGFNELDHFIRLLVGEKDVRPLTIRAGWFLRSLSEIVVAKDKLIS